MGRYGIGARVRDKDGDEGVIVAKRKGEREVGYEDAPLGGMRLWWPKAELTAVATEKPSVEKGEVAFAVGDRVTMKHEVDGNFSPLVAKIVLDDGDDFHPLLIEFEGDAGFGHGPGSRQWHVDSDDLQRFTLEAGRLYRTRDGRKVGPMVVGAGGCIESARDGTQAAAFHEEEMGSYTADGIWLTSDGSANEDIVGLWTEPAAEPAAEPAPAALTIEAGRYYRTRDGRKVGPMEHSDGRYSSQWPFTVGHELAHASRFGKAWRADGTFDPANDESPADLVAEWVESEAVPVRLDLSVGDKVTLANGATATVIEVMTDGGAFPFVHDRGEDSYHAVTATGKSCLNESDMDIVDVVPQPKFKVGDKVDLMRDGEPVERWSNMTITSMDNDSTLYPIMTDGGLQVHEDELRLSPVKPAWKPKFKVGDVVNYILAENSWQGTTITEVPESEGRIYLGKHPREGEGGFFEDQIVAAPATPLPAVGTKVTLTAIVTGHNPADRKNVQVVVNGLPPGRNSIGVSPSALSIAA